MPLRCPTDCRMAYLPTIVSCLPHLPTASPPPTFFFDTKLQLETHACPLIPSLCSCVPPGFLHDIMLQLRTLAAPCLPTHCGPCLPAACPLI